MPSSYTIKKRFSLVEFLWLYNGTSNVAAFAYFSVLLYISVVVLTLIRCIVEEENGWTTAVFVLNLCTFILVTADAKFWSFTNALSLFFVITAESLCLAANILVGPLLAGCLSPTLPFLHTHADLLHRGTQHACHIRHGAIPGLSAKGILRFLHRVHRP